MDNLDELLDKLVEKIDKLEKQSNNKGWTLDNVYESIIQEFPKLAYEISNDLYKCIRASIIEVISSSYENNDTKKKLINDILISIVDCKKKEYRKA
jgi:hypothetical protein